MGKGLEPVAAYLAEDEIVELAKRHDDRRDPPGLRPAVRARVVRAQVPRRRHHVHRADARGDRRAGRQGRGAQDRRGRRRADRPRDARARVKTRRGGARLRRQVGYPVIIKASGGRRRARHARRARRRRARGAADARALRGAQGVRRRLGVHREAGGPAQAHRGADPRRQPRQPRPPVRARLLGAAPPPEGDRVRARLVAAAGAARAAGRRRAEDRAPGRSYTQRRHRRVPGRRGRRALLHRGQPAHPGRAHGHRGDHGARPGAGPDPDRAGLPACPIRRSASAARTRSSSAASRSRCASPPRIRATTSCPTPARSRSTARRSATGIRLDDGSGYVGARVSPYYDSLLAKITASGLEWNYVRRKVIRALREFRIRGVKTNLAFLENVLSHPTFAAGKAHTTFIDETPELMQMLAAPRPRHAHPALRRVDDRQRPPDRARQAEAADVGAVARARAAARAPAGAASRAPSRSWRRRGRPAS